MKIILTSVFVDDQDKALVFYTEKLGFVKKQDVPLGKFKWLTVVSPDDPDGTELLLEPSDNPAAQEFKRAVFADNLPAASFGVANVSEEYQRLKDLGVEFTMTPTQMGPVKIAVLNDTCGNLVQLMER